MLCVLVICNELLIQYFFVFRCAGCFHAFIFRYSKYLVSRPTDKGVGTNWYKLRIQMKKVKNVTSLPSSLASHSSCKESQYNRFSLNLSVSLPLSLFLYIRAMAMLRNAHVFGGVQNPLQDTWTECPLSLDPSLSSDQVIFTQPHACMQVFLNVP